MFSSEYPSLEPYNSTGEGAYINEGYEEDEDDDSSYGDADDSYPTKTRICYWDKVGHVYN